jgi:hypothetical protein
MKTVPKPSAKPSPETLLDELRAELARLYGQNFAALCLMEYRRSWYYLSMPRRVQGGRLEMDPLPRPYTRSEVESLLEKLRSSYPRT